MNVKKLQNLAQETQVQHVIHIHHQRLLFMTDHPPTSSLLTKRRVRV
jgi:hypothetical protein